MTERDTWQCDGRREERKQKMRERQTDRKTKTERKKQTDKPLQEDKLKVVIIRKQ